MSRSGYVDDYDCDPLEMGRWRAQVKSAIRGKRGQQFLRELVEALEAMPQKRLIRDSLRQANGEVCAIGALGVKRGVNMEALDPDNPEQVGAAFNIAPQLAQEVVYYNDDMYSHKTPEERWRRMHSWALERLKQ